MKPITVPHDYEPIFEHTDVDLFCPNMSCPCHEDQENIALVAQDVEKGFLTTSEADRYLRGQNI